jgi:hypothetical protein
MNNGKQIGLVGQSEGSRRSQGHYRLYFGLGEDAMVSSIRIHWPDGSVETIENPSVDTLLTISKESTL